jgi:hypothetical protein
LRAAAAHASMADRVGRRARARHAHACGMRCAQRRALARNPLVRRSHGRRLRVAEPALQRPHAWARLAMPSHRPEQ